MPDLTNGKSNGGNTRKHRHVADEHPVAIHIQKSTLGKHLQKYFVSEFQVLSYILLVSAEPIIQENSPGIEQIPHGFKGLYAFEVFGNKVAHKNIRTNHIIAAFVPFQEGSGIGCKDLDFYLFG